MAHYVTIVLYRRRLSLTSGAGQLVRMQAEGLRAAGEDAVAACRRGALKFRLKTHLPVRRMSADSLGRLAASPRHLVVDHQMASPAADVVFVHNLMTEAVRHVPRDDWSRQASREVEFFRALRPDAPVVANSRLVKRALLGHFALDPGRVVVHYPGFAADRFGPRDGHSKYADLRGSLGVAADAPLIGFVTSGEFDKRGLDIFLASAERIADAKPHTRFLVVGAKRLPAEARRHPLVRNGRVLYRPKSSRPERWFAALDIFLYPARFEEFGMVVSEAQACRLPVLTSRRVGAAECLPAEYAPWLLDEPEAEAFAANALALLADETARQDLVSAGVSSVAAFDHDRYVQETVALIRECARVKRGARTGS